MVRWLGGWVVIALTTQPPNKSKTRRRPFGPRRVSKLGEVSLRLGGEQVGDPVLLLAVFADHLLEYDRVPARQALFDGDEVFSGPAAKAKFLDEIQIRQNAALH